MEKMYSGRRVEVGFERGGSCGAVSYHKDKDIERVVHGIDFALCGLEMGPQWIKDLMHGWSEIKVRATLGQDCEDDKGVVTLGRMARWITNEIQYEADRKHRRIRLDRFGFDEKCRPLVNNGEKDYKEESERD